MRFANHSFDPVAKVVEVGNGRRTTVVVVTTKRSRRGQEITADYGDDLCFDVRVDVDGWEVFAPSALANTSSIEVTSLSRLGGGDLRAFRDILGKRSIDDDDLDNAEASFAKAKRVRAQLATEALRQKLSTIQNTWPSLGSSMTEMVLLLHEENEMKVEAR
ncbi:hypothetical protein L914_21172 [Phytophthora nicotianae]|uniref:SET domain-containing protein n=1 Tax=Phytophthora nicotianae TaxID=4792 RepID=W2M484_PHYNI|nr:hypothetical protein L914_21172 [Phytophthora nicotianae]